MKQIKVFNKLALLFFLILIGCKKEDVLPDITHDGRNTFGMLINGEIWQPYVPGVFSPSSNAPSIKYDETSNLLIIEAENLHTNESLFFISTNIKNIGIYHFSYKQYANVPDSLINIYDFCKDSTRFELNFICSGSYKLQDSLISKLEITRLDISAKIISGTFSLKMKNQTGNYLEITEGRFDAKYNQSK